MDEINILYIDDDPENYLSEYLDNYRIDGFHKTFLELKFNQREGYESLLNKVEVKKANILFIDSKLYKNSSALNGKFTGEEFKLILKKFLPFTETFIITQNEVESGIDVIKKFMHNDDMFVADKQDEAKQYYDKTIHSKIKEAIQNINQYRKLAYKLEKNNDMSSLLKERVLNALNGCEEYDELKKTDLDRIISLFKELQEQVK